MGKTVKRGYYTYYVLITMTLKRWRLNQESICYRLSPSCIYRRVIKSFRFEIESRIELEWGPLSNYRRYVKRW